ncbi:MAG: hypothetical protein C0598_03390 [Marinilabiliales bacterium]|nr:MAG: hypothetical protein C0598_03390 [Marinilabiliales bacterium]
MRFATNKILTLFFYCIILSAFPQKELTTFTKNDGLSSSNILFTYVDSKGIIWAATNFGLNAYFSNKWTAIKYIEGQDGQNKYFGKILSIFEASNSDIWIATQRGIFYYNRKYWTHFSDNENSNFEISKLFEDSNMNIWVFLENQNGLKDVGQIGFTMLEGKVQIFGGNQWITFTGVIGGSAAVPIGSPPNYFTSMLIDSKNTIWITSLDGLYSYDGRRWSEFNEEQLSSDKCYKVFETNNHDIWVGTANGIAKKEGEKWKKYEKAKGISGNIIHDFYNDKQGRLWAFSSKDNSFNSLLLFNKSKWKTFTNKDLRLKGNVDKIFEINNQVFISSSRGISVYQNSIWKNINNVYDVNVDEVYFLQEIQEGLVYFTDKSKLYQLSKDGVQIVFEYDGKWQANEIFMDSQQRIWVGTDRDGLFLFENDKLVSNFNDKSGLTDNHINSIFEDSEANVWIICRNSINKVND